MRRWKRLLANPGILFLLISVFFLVPSIPPLLASSILANRDLSYPWQSGSINQVQQPDIKSSPSTFREREPEQKIHPNLEEWLRSGIPPRNLRCYNGQVSVILGVNESIDFEFPEAHLQVRQVHNMGHTCLVHGFIQSPKSLQLLVACPDVDFVMGDQRIEFEPTDSSGFPEDIPTTSQYKVQEIIGADQVLETYPSINGSGVTIGIVDTGVDFGVSDLATAYHVNSSGYPTSFDPSGTGIAITSYVLPFVGGYLLTEGLDFYMWHGESGSIVKSNSTYGIYTQNMKVGGSGGISSASGFYRVGMAVQNAKGLPEELQFFIFLIVDETIPFLYDTLYIDWETSWAITAEFNGISGPNYYEWDFAGNKPHRWGDGTEVLAGDIDGDGFNDISMGCLANTFDLFGIMGGDLFSGIDPQGRGFAYMYDYDGHGTAVAGAAVGRGTCPFDVFSNGTLRTLPGIAPDAKVMALKLLTWGDIINCWFWGSGYRHTIPDYQMWYEWDHCAYLGWNYSNQAHILSNSWGMNDLLLTPPYNFVWGCDWYSYTMDFLATGGIVDPYYNATGWTMWPDGKIQPAPLFIVSQGNGGPGYGTGGSPSSAGSLHVGASTLLHAGHLLPENSTPPGPIPMDQIHFISSSGPTPQALPKPDLVAPGSGLFSLTALHYIRNSTGSPSNSPLPPLVFSGTSVATAIVAGAAALVYQAYDWPKEPQLGHPDTVKCILKSTSEDLYHPAFKMGAGRVNVLRAVHAAFGNVTDGNTPILTAGSSHTFTNFAPAHSPAGWSRSWYMNMYYGKLISSIPYLGESYYHPGFAGVTFFDASLATHGIKAGQSLSVNFTVFGGSVNFTSPASGGGDTAESGYGTWYEMSHQAQVNVNPTGAESSWMLADLFDSTAMSEWATADYAVLAIAYDWTTFTDRYKGIGTGNRAMLLDWQDLDSDGDVNLSSEVRIIAWDDSAGNVHQLAVGRPGSQFLLNPGAILYYFDESAATYPYNPPALTVTLRLFRRTTWSWITINQYASLETPRYPYEWNVTIQVPDTTSPGLYTGFIVFTNGTGQTLIPTVVRVDGRVMPGDSLSWGGSDGHPYDNGATMGAINWEGVRASGDWRFYMVDISDTDVDDNFTTWVMTNVTWADPNTCIDVYILMAGYGNNAYLGGWDKSDTEYISGGQWNSTTTWTRQNVILTDYTWGPGSATARGYLIVALHVTSFGGSYLPENFTIIVTPVNNATQHGFRGLPGPTGIITCTSAGGIPQNTQVTDDSIWTGPHVVFNGTFDPWGLDGFSTLKIRETDLQYFLPDTVVIHGLFTAENCTPDTIISGPWDYEYIWEDITAGNWLEIHLRVPDPPGNPGVPPHDLELILETPSGKLIAISTMVGSIEDIYVTAPESGDYTIGVDYWGIDEGANYQWGGWPGNLPWILTATKYTSIPHAKAGLTAGFDTQEMGQNIAIALKLKVWTGTSLDLGTGMDIDVTNVSITNFFAPTVFVTSPNGGEEYDQGLIPITWAASDFNLPDEVLSFSVEVSNDSGLTWQVLTYSTTLRIHTWDSTSSYYGLPTGDQFLVRVNVTDGRYTASDTSDAVWSIVLEGPLIIIDTWPIIPVVAIIVILSVILVIFSVKQYRDRKFWMKVGK